MTPLRTTQSAVIKHLLPLARLGVACAAFGVFGCGSASVPTSDSSPAVTAAPGANDPSWINRETLPSPDAERIEYDAKKRTLTFQDLPGRDRWMVRLPDESNGRSVGPVHTLPEGVDLSRTLVYYVRPGARSSAPITVAQIEAGRAAHVSLAAQP